MFILILILFIVAYILGSIPFGLILTKVFTGQDLRKIGSNSIGTTNVLRTGNKILTAVTLLCDMGKGAVPILFVFGGLPSISQPFLDLSDFFIPIALTIGLGAIVGHCFPVWLKFKGGKGVATTFGVLLAAVPYSGLAALATWLIVAVTTRYSSLSALCAYITAPIVTFFVYGSMPASISLAISILIWVRHKDNIKRLLNGTENKIGHEKKVAN
ncbi:MAG: glycerol-3-phosphate 1-O-acyltransferase PlsY [Alphaproteobacteria bacterium]|nr:glycerol-3-phosphate 1-O-acyltransferase PlsY [Alphaproteobacteria bacterium]